jgi:hypothetical protein
MTPTKKGQIVKFHTPNENENSEQTYVILEFIEDGSRSKAKLQAGNTGLSFPSISLVLVQDLEVDELQTAQLDYYLKYANHNLF